MDFSNQSEIENLRAYFRLSEEKRLIGLGLVKSELTYQEKVIEINKLTFKILDCAKELYKQNPNL
jgi:hypothetical protein